MMHSWHMAEFRTPSSQQTFEYTKSSDQELRLTHFLAADCSCSLHLLDYFIKRGALKDHPEKIVLIGDIPKKEALLKKAGFVIEKVTMEEAMGHHNDYDPSETTFLKDHDFKEAS